MSVRLPKGCGSVLLGVICLAGCAPDDRLFPLREGNEWDYTVKTGLAEYLEKVKVSRQIPVAGTRGFELTSAMGVSRLAWKDQTLYATALTGTRFHPPLPLLSSADEKATLKWQGRMYAAGKTYEASALVQQSPESLTRDGRRISTIKTAMIIRLPDRELEILTWYAPGTGIINQVQRTRREGQDGGRFDIETDFLSGP